jgi:hypothetical protein
MGVAYWRLRGIAMRTASVQDYLVIVLTLATAVIHVVVAVDIDFPVLALNGAGYVAILVAIYTAPNRFLSSRRRPRIALGVYAALAMVLWAGGGKRDLLAYIDKVVEIVLIVVLVAPGVFRNRSRATT